MASSLEILTPLCDFVARISNDQETPQLRAYIRVDSRGNWGARRTLSLTLTLTLILILTLTKFKEFMVRARP